MSQRFRRTDACIWEKVGETEIETLVYPHCLRGTQLDTQDYRLEECVDTQDYQQSNDFETQEYPLEDSNANENPECAPMEEALREDALSDHHLYLSDGTLTSWQWMTVVAGPTSEADRRWLVAHLAAEKTENKQRKRMLLV